jgi:hypothetical protein
MNKFNSDYAIIIEDTDPDEENKSTKTCVALLENKYYAEKIAVFLKLCDDSDPNREYKVMKIERK